MKLRITSIVVLLSTVLLLCGCTEQGDNHTFSTDSNSNISENNSLDNPNDSLEYSNNSDSEQESSSNSAPNLSSTLTPLSFNDEDLELQEILGGLMAGGASEAYEWFYSFTIPNPLMKKIKFNGNCTYDDMDNKYDYYPIPENYKDNILTFPSTCDKMEETIGRFFTKQATANFMKYVSKGTITGEENGVLLVTLDNDIEASMPPYYLDVGGVMYHLDINGVHTLNLDWETARVTAKSDGRIEFTFLPYTYEYLPTTEFRYEELYYDYAQEGYIELEDSGWKFPLMY